MKDLIKFGAVMAGSVLATGFAMAPGAAHHSGSMFDPTRTVSLVGVVKEVRWTNPHVTLMVNGKSSENGKTGDNDQDTDWLLEMSSPSNLVRVSNWTRASVKIGDHVKVQMAPLRDNSGHGGNLKTLILTDTGQSFTPNIRDREEPGLE
jgi:Family of unknown function (DUF6152)